MRLSNVRLGLFLATALTALPVAAEEPALSPSSTSLEQQFRDPPGSARPRVWWHWMNGNVSKDGIAKDMAWMKRVGIGGLQNFDANLQTPQVVDKRLVYMTPEWKDAFRFTAAEADRLGLELAIASSPGWSETGGPWVPPQDGLKKLVWSETVVTGGKRFAGKLAAPPSITGPYQSIAKGPSIDDLLQGGQKGQAGPSFYGDVAVLAIPAAPGQALPAARLLDRDGKAVDGAALNDGDFGTVVELARNGSVRPSLTFEYPAAQSVRSASLFLPGASMMFVGANVAPVLEASDDGKSWRKIADIPAAAVPTTVGFAPVTARWFRIVFAPRTGGSIPLSLPSPGVDMSLMTARYSGLGGGTTMLRVAEAALSAEDRIDRAEAKAGFEIEPDYYALSPAVTEASGPATAQVINLTDRMRSDGTLDWTPPKGQWRVLRLGWSLLGTTNHPAPKEATGLEVDKFDGAAVRRYLEHYIGMYRDAAGPDLIGAKGVRALLTDSIEVGAANWTPRLVERFRELRGYDPTPWLPALTGALIGTRAQSDAFLYDFRRTLADLMASDHYGTVAKVAHENGLKVYGEALESGRPSLGDDMAMRSHADIPMSAMWTHSRKEGPRPSHVVDVRGAASVAHIYGQNLVAAESLTSSLAFWDQAPNYLKRIIDLEFVNGVNRPVIHTSVHQPVDDKVPGLALFIFGQYFNRHESWAEMARPWVDYMSRNSLMLQQGRNIADVGYFYGEEAPLTGLYEKGPVPDAPRTSAYDFVNADALMTALRNDGDDVVTPGGARYRTLYLGGSSRRMTLPALQKLAALVEGGATVVGKKPEGSPALGNDMAAYSALTAKLWPGGEEARVGKGRVIASTDIEASLRRTGVAPDFRFENGQADADIPFVHRKLADGDSYFLVNRKDRTEVIEAHFRVTGKRPELWNAETGTSEAVSYRIVNGETIVPLTLNADDSIHIVFRQPAPADALMLKKAVPTAIASIDGAWTVQFQPGRGAPASATFGTLKPLDENADAAIKYFSGIATYSQSFQAPKGWKAGQPLWIDLGEAKEVAEISVNGKSAGSTWRAPYRVDISSLVKAGTNTLEVKVANLWVNRLIGDAQPDAKKVTWTAGASYRKDAPLRRSGLIGPVKLLGIR